MSTTEEIHDAQIPTELEALLEALRRKTNYQSQRIDELEAVIEELEEQLEEATE